MKLNIYKNQHKILKTYEVDEYDLMYGTVEDILDLFDAVGTNNQDDLLKTIAQNKKKLNDLLLDIFGGEGLTEDELRNIKIKELVPVFIDLFAFVKNSFNSSKN